MKIATPIAQQVVLIFAKSEDSSSLHKVLVENDTTDVHAVFKDGTKSKKLFVEVDKKGIAESLGRRAEAAKTVLTAMAQKMLEGDTVSFTREEVLKILADAGELPDKQAVEIISADITATGPFSEGFTNAQVETEVIAQSATTTSVNPVLDRAVAEESGSGPIGIAIVEEDVA